MGTKTVGSIKKKWIEIEEDEEKHFLVCDFCGNEALVMGRYEDIPEADGWRKIENQVSHEDGTQCGWVLGDFGKKGEWIAKIYLCPKCWPTLNAFIESKRKRGE